MKDINSKLKELDKQRENLFKQEEISEMDRAGDFVAALGFSLKYKAYVDSRILKTDGKLLGGGFDYPDDCHRKDLSENLDKDTILAGMELSRPITCGFDGIIYAEKTWIKS